VKNDIIDYGWSEASIWIPDDADPLRMFSLMANQMFGIRKSITRTPEAAIAANTPPGLDRVIVPYAMALSHDGDLATFDAEGNKLLDEWGHLYGVDADQVIGAAKITGRTDYAAIAAELKAKEAAGVQG
jgi:hypothetical protein